MKKQENIKSYTATELKKKQRESATNLQRLDALSDEQLEKKITEEGLDVQIDWTRAKLVVPQAKKSVHLRLEKDVIAFFKKRGKGHISLMQAVLKAYVDAQRSAIHPHKMN